MPKRFRGLKGTADISQLRQACGRPIQGQCLVFHVIIALRHLSGQGQCENLGCSMTTGNVTSARGNACYNDQRVPPTQWPVAGDYDYRDQSLRDWGLAAGELDGKPPSPPLPLSRPIIGRCSASGITRRRALHVSGFGRRPRRCGGILFRRRKEWPPRLSWERHLRIRR